MTRLLNIIALNLKEKGFSVKKLMMLVLTGLSVMVLNGCGGGSSSYNDGLTTLFLVDEYGSSYAYIPYQCYDQGVLTSDTTTLSNGEFSFYPGEECEFDFTGYSGVYGDEYDEIIRIVDYTDDGKDLIPYECELFGVAGTTYYTYSDGSFDYDANDACIFYL